jgi:MSHA biogenesis protein MshN
VATFLVVECDSDAGRRSGERLVPDAMSLINQVLIDLEKRHAGVADTGAMARAVRPLPEERSRRGRWIGLAVVVIAMLAGGAWWWAARNPDALPSFAAQKVLPAPAVASAAVTTAAPPQPPQPVVAKVDVPPVTTAAPAPAHPAPLNAVPPAPPVSGSATPRLAAAHEPLPARIASAGPKLDAPAAPSPNASRADTANINSVKQAQAGAAAPGAVSSPQPLTAAMVGTQDKKESAPLTTQPPQSDDAEPATISARARPAAPRSKPRVVADSTPKVPAQGVEYPDANAAQADANIAKQVRPQTDRDRAEGSFRQGMSALHTGNTAEAEMAFREALRLDPLVDKARQALLGMYIEGNRRPEAERLLDDRLQVDPKHFGFAMALARLQLERGGNGDALVTLQRSLAYGESSAEYQAVLANALSRVARHKEAAERYAAAGRLAPRNPLWQMGLGVELRADNRNAEARGAFQRARELGGLNAQLTAYLEQQLRELQ